MNTITKICIGVITGVGAIWSLGGFNSNDTNSHKKNHSSTNRKTPNNLNQQNSVVNDVDQNFSTPKYPLPLLSDDGPDATDLDDPCEYLVSGNTYCSSNNNNNNATNGDNPRNETRFISNIRTVQSTFTRIRNVFDFIISVGANFLRLFGNNSPKSNVQPSVIIY